MADPLTNYFAMISGLNKATRARARAAAQTLVSQAGLDDVAADATELITKMTEEITGASRANRELLENLIAAEVDKAAGRLGFTRGSELSAMRADLTALTARVVVLESRSHPTAKTATTKKAAASKTASATTAPAKKTSAPAQKTTAQKTTAQKTTAKKATAKKATAKTSSSTEESS